MLCSVSQPASNGSLEKIPESERIQAGPAANRKRLWSETVGKCSLKKCLTCVSCEAQNARRGAGVHVFDAVRRKSLHLPFCFLCSFVEAVLEAFCPLERSLGRPCSPDAAPPWGALVRALACSPLSPAISSSSPHSRSFPLYLPLHLSLLLSFPTPSIRLFLTFPIHSRSLCLSSLQDWR